jgi:hypothetical protein
MSAPAQAAKPVLDPAIASYFAAPSPLSAPGAHAGLLAPLPADPAGIASVVQGLVLYEHVAAAFYGVAIPEARRGESHLRPLARMLDALLALDAAPLAVARPPERRLVGVCRHFTLLAVALLRDKGVPARARSGFGAYFNPGYFEDHWVCEYWHAAERRWALLDAQIDAVWRAKLGIAGDMTDVPRDRFLTASDAWRACRRGEHDAARFGIEFGRLRGLWFVACNLVRDLAALNKWELLPWDVWGAQPMPGTALDAEQLAFFDELAELMRWPDETFAALRGRHDGDARLRVPPHVFNPLTQREEAVLAA